MKLGCQARLINEGEFLFPTEKLIPVLKADPGSLKAADGR